MLWFKTKCFEWTLCQWEELYGIDKLKLTRWKLWHKNKYLSITNIINYCIFKVRSETEDKEGKVIWLNGPKESEKQVKKPAECPKRVRNKGNYGSFVELSRLHEMIKYELYECFY